MADKIKLDIVSDVVCPWCIVGYKRLEKAISDLGVGDRIEIEWQPFELNPQMPAEGQELAEHIAQKYGSTPEQGEKSRAHLTQFGSELNFKFDFFEKMKIVNTRDAHIIIDYAKEFGKQTKLNVNLITAYFSEQKDISDRNILTQQLQGLGLNAEEALARLDDTNARENIQTKEAFWQNMGVSSVPTMVFDRKSALTGAQSVETYKQVLTELFEK
jgi:predicted DsbA family dithiol-disulfide isomerase